jgi:hypothetical protein
MSQEHAASHLDADEVRQRVDVSAFYARETNSQPQRAGHGEEKFRCPFHLHDDHPSLRVVISPDGHTRRGDYRCDPCAAQGIDRGGDIFAFVKRLRGCSFPEAVRCVAEFAGMVSESDAPPPKMRLVATYVYQNADGTPRFEELRYEDGQGNKTFKIRHKGPDGTDVWAMPEGPRVPYNLPLLVERPGARVYVPEGTKCVDRITLEGAVATTNALGAGKWGPDETAAVAGRPEVIVLPDNDPPGRDHGQKVAAAVYGQVAVVKVVELPGLPPKGDVVDWLDAGHSLAELDKITDAAPAWEPPAEQVPATGQASPTGEADSLATRWPAPLAPQAFHGVMGDLVRLIYPHTEADPVALLLSGLVAFGSVIGRGPHFVADGAPHFTNLYLTLVGDTSKSRKGSSWAQIRRPLESVDPDWRGRVQSGLSSGEGLIWHVRDAIMKTRPVEETDKNTKRRTVVDYEDVIEDPGIEDKRLLAFEGEFASTLRVMSRDGNSLSGVVRTAWDTGDLSTLVKNSPAKATRAHISIVGHVTRDEVLRYLDRTELASGFGNRFLWACAQRSKLLPDGGRIQELDFAPVVRCLNEAVGFARGVGEVTRDEAARGLWHEVYADLSEGMPGLVGAVTARAEAQVMRLALIYALLDLSPVIRREHLEAALAAWRYCEASARYVFADVLGDPTADAILHAARQSADRRMNRTEINRLFAGHKGAHQIERALGLLQARGLMRCVKEQTGGAPVEWWYATRPGETN